MSKRLSNLYIEKTLREISDDDDFSSGSGDDYEPSDSESSIDGQENEDVNSECNSERDSSDEDKDQEVVDVSVLAPVAETSNFEANIWSTPEECFIPRKVPSSHREPALGLNYNRTDTPLQVFKKTFPPSLIMYITQCTNERIEILRTSKKKHQHIQRTDVGEIKMILGCMIIMSYNHVPSTKHYWSNHQSLGNEAIKSAIARDRYLFLSSKLYCAPPDKPANASKTYYLDDIIECLKARFQDAREDSPFQSIDESMTKFKGRSSLKQYMPLKPTKRGIKMWMRCDSLSGYVYDFYIYCGKEDGPTIGTLGERVVHNLAKTIRHPDVTLCFDRFFTSVHLLETLEYPALGTVMTNRKNLPKLTAKLPKGEAIFKSCSSGIMYTKWHDTREVAAISNCHKSSMSTIEKKLKNGEKVVVPCPEIIKFYRSIMGGVDRADQLSGMYELDRKSQKWWKKVLYRLLMMSAVNSWIIYMNLHRKKEPFLEFLVQLAEGLIAEGQQTAVVRRSLKHGGYHSKKKRIYGQSASHLPIEGTSRRRCTGCQKKKIEKRTKTICQECQLPLCKDCFAPFHQ